MANKPTCEEFFTDLLEFLKSRPYWEHVRVYKENQTTVQCKDCCLVVSYTVQPSNVV
jgi:hypothetical protein